MDLKKEAPTCSRKERIAVIGSGPAGLSAAYHLARLGFPVTILECLPEPGGMLRYGIPEYRLPREILRKEIGFIRQLGVEIRTGVRAGRDHTLVEIKNEYQAVFIAVGAHEGIRLGIEGEDLPGVLEGIKFLREFNLGKKAELGQRVAVIGGGNTAIDCARTARRLGADPVAVIYRRSRARNAGPFRRCEGLRAGRDKDRSPSVARAVDSGKRTAFGHGMYPDEAWGGGWGRPAEAFSHQGNGVYYSHRYGYHGGRAGSRGCVCAGSRIRREGNGCD